MRKPQQWFWTLALLVGGGNALDGPATTNPCNNDTGTCEASSTSGDLNDQDGMNYGYYKQQQHQPQGQAAHAFQSYQQEVKRGTGSYSYQYHSETMYQTHSYQTPPREEAKSNEQDDQSQDRTHQHYEQNAPQEGSSTGYPVQNNVSNPSRKVSSTTTMANDACVDKNDSCSQWAESGACQDNPQYMNLNCRKSCMICTPASRFGGKKPRQGEDLGVAQIMFDEDGTKQEDVYFLIHKARSYMKFIIPQKFKADMYDTCTNKYDRCAMWALDGKCDSEEWMRRGCGPICGSCHAHTIEDRCPVDPDAPNAWGAGDLNRLFTKLSSEPYLSKHDVQILSSPDTTGGPWIITMENIVSAEEAERFIDLGSEMGFQRSSDVGKVKADGTFDRNISSGRTSTNTWCHAPCSQDEVISPVIERLNSYTEVADVNAESLQLLRYEKDQFYQVHHDYIPFQRDRQEGCRILTAFLYLSNVEAGGGTRFDKLDLTVLPKLGRMLLWPSVLDESPHDMDDRTTHTALPVEEGVKYGANAWFHQRDFKTPNSNGCS